MAENAGAEILLRPKEMGSDTAEVDPLIIWSLDRLNATQEKNLVSLLYCTAPLRNSDDILKTVELVSNGIVDSALTLVETSDYLWKEARMVSFQPIMSLKTGQPDRKKNGTI